MKKILFIVFLISLFSGCSIIYNYVINDNYYLTNNEKTMDTICKFHYGGHALLYDNGVGDKCGLKIEIGTCVSSNSVSSEHYYLLNGNYILLEELLLNEDSFANCSETNLSLYKECVEKVFKKHDDYFCQIFYNLSNEK